MPWIPAVAARISPLRPLLAPLLVTMALGLKWALDPAFSEKTPFLFFFPAVIIAAWLGGWLHGLAAILLSGTATFISFDGIPHLSMSQYAGALPLGLFVAESAFFVWLVSTLQRSRRDAVAQLDESASALTLIENLVETVPSAIVATDERGNITLFNRAAQTLTGYDRAEVLARPLLDLFVPAAWQETVKLRFDPSRRDTIRDPHRNPWILKDGTERMIEWRCAAMDTPRGSCILGVGHDVTETMILEQARDESIVIEQHARAAAEEANRTKDVFLATVSHELRSPLTAIMGWVELIRMTPDDPDMRERGLNALEDSAKSQARLVEDLLDLSRAHAGKLHLRPARMDVRPLIDSTVELVLPEVQRKQLTIETVYDEDTLFVNADHERLRQVMANLLQNALRYTESGRIEIRVQRRDSHAEVIISDTGRGISSDFLPHIFEPFTREASRSQADKQSGVGIGLAVVKRLVELHGGSVAAESDGDGKGSQFRVTLPLAAEATAS